MRALTVRPGVKDSLALSDLPEPATGDGPILVESLAVGLCGTDIEIVSGEYGEAPPGSDVLVLGHENLGRVLDAPADGDVATGDLVVGFVRRPDPVPCPACAVGEWDMCRNGRYTEHGIKGLHGFARERWRAQPDAVVTLDARPGRGRRAAGTDHHRRQGVGTDRTDRAAGLLRAQGRRGHRRRTGRTARGTARRPARPRGARLRSRDRRSEARAGRRSRRALPRGVGAGQRRAGRHRRRMHRRAVRRRGRDDAQRDRRDRLPDRRLVDRRPTAGRHRQV